MRFDAPRPGDDVVRARSEEHACPAASLEEDRKGGRAPVNRPLSTRPNLLTALCRSRPVGPFRERDRAPTTPPSRAPAFSGSRSAIVPAPRPRAERRGHWSFQDEAPRVASRGPVNCSLAAGWWRRKIGSPRGTVSRTSRRRRGQRQPHVKTGGSEAAERSGRCSSVDMEVPGRTVSGRSGLVGLWRAPGPPLRRRPGRPWTKRSRAGAAAGRPRSIDHAINHPVESGR